MANTPVQYSPIQVSDKNIQLIQSQIQKVIAQLQQAGQFPYTPETASNWVSPAPSSLQSALDRMASLLVTLHGAPIP